jgi:hypothetical protein
MSFTYFTTHLLSYSTIPQLLLSGALGYWKWQAEHLAIA